MISFSIALAGLAAWAIAATLELVARDGYGRIATRFV